MLDQFSKDRSQPAGGTTVLQAVFQTLAYSDVFDYPLTASEVYRYLTSSNATFQEVTEALAERSLFSQTGEFFTLRGREQIVETRKERARVGERLWGKAAFYGRLLASLPFVRMVAITGSLAMSNTEEGKDVDYMIVTAPDHLWTCRALALLLARIAAVEGMTLCPNYLVTTKALELKEQSLYVAHELAQMVPIAGLEMYEEIRKRNLWVEAYLPHAAGSPEAPDNVKVVEGFSAAQRVLETLLSNPLGQWFEQWERKRKIERLTREQAHSFESYFSADVCKGHLDKHGESLSTALAVRLQKAAELAKLT